MKLRNLRKKFMKEGKNMKFKKVFAAALAVVLAAGLTACGGSSETSSSGTSDEPVKIRVWGAEEDQTLLAELIAKFEAQYPDVVSTSSSVWSPSQRQRTRS